MQLANVERGGSTEALASVHSRLLRFERSSDLAKRITHYIRNR